MAAALDSLAGLPDAVEHAMARNADLRRDDARLVLATMHTTKGLEFDHVAVIGLDDGSFPSERTLSELRGSQPGARGGAPTRLRGVDSREPVTAPPLRPVGAVRFLREAFDDAELAA